NNRRSLPLRVVLQPRRALLIDGRPRWDMRYLRNFLERDAEWEVTALIAEDRPNAGRWRPGQTPAEFPKNAAALFDYDIAILGDIPSGCLLPAECELLRDFVGKRGGGLLLVDGCRGGLGALTDSALAEILPLTWGKQNIAQAQKMHLTPQGKTAAPLSLVATAEANDVLWQQLPAPRWLAAAVCKPGAAVWLEAEAEKGAAVPLVIARRYGAGQAIYVGTDETWRWRYPAADEYQEKFWRQLIAWAAEPPFAVRDERVALDVSAMVAQPGEAVEVRARLRGPDGMPLLDTNAWAEICRETAVVATVPLAADENQGGIYRGRTPALAPGRYRVRVRADSLPESSDAVWEEFEVKAMETGELADLSCHETLLRSISRASRGSYLREEECQRLPALLQALSQGRIEETETVLWQSGWWFGALVALLGVEWLWRKRRGLL
ncbi:MAG: hypothetical protein N3A66_05815, partial [Planctomycetota bacterium]|nr:hypothetical protein [Planctomycetota bacterium]